MPRPYRVFVLAMPLILAAGVAVADERGVCLQKALHDFGEGQKACNAQHGKASTKRSPEMTACIKQAEDKRRETQKQCMAKK